MSNIKGRDSRYFIRTRGRVWLNDSLNFKRIFWFVGIRTLSFIDK